MFTSILPGRVRARLPLDMPESKLEDFRAALAGAALEMKARHNPRSAGLLVTWKPGPRRDAAVMRVLRSRVPASAKGASATPSAVTMPSMKTVNKGMAASLGVALMALAFRSGRAHMWAGGVFALFLGRHLYVYRRRLFK